MILDRAGDLKTLAELASSKADASSEDAALAVVEERVNGARTLFASMGMARVRPLQLLEANQRAEVVRAGKHLREALGVLAEASDVELAAYAAGGEDTRGSLLAVGRQASALRTALLAGQTALLQRLATSVWPDGNLARLEVIAHLSDRPAIAATARRVQEVYARLLARAEGDGGLQSEELQELIDQATAASSESGPLLEEEVPEEVVRFWEEASTEEGVGLDALTPEVQAWLEAHRALLLFTVIRNR